jgi:hypothetical protein
LPLHGGKCYNDIVKTYGEFAALCKEQNVGLYDGLERDQPALSFTWEPTQVLRAIAQAGVILRVKPGARLVRKPVVFNDTKPDFSLKVLGDIVNATYSPAAPSIRRPAFSSPKTAGHLCVCEEAEGKFLDTVRDLTDKTSDQSDDFGCEIMTVVGRPTFLRKSGIVASSLSLRPVIIGGIPYPAGSLLRINLPDEVNEEGTPTYPNVPYRAYKVTPVVSFACIGFLRLSAFALPPAERQEVFDASDSTTDPATIALFNTTTIEKICASIESTVPRLNASASV